MFHTQEMTPECDKKQFLCTWLLYFFSDKGKGILCFTESSKEIENTIESFGALGLYHFN